MQFLGLSGAGKTTFSLIECCFNNTHLIDSDLLYKKIYKTSIITLIDNYKEQVFRKLENTLNTVILSNQYPNTLGGGSIKNYTTLKQISSYKIITLTNTHPHSHTPITRIYNNKQLWQEREKEFKFKHTLSIKNEK
ncbi:hypothetical protein JSR02_00820 [Candidatus Vidania fulgoroideae]|uniref:Shikimate kinase n=1 Tax=Candidatus Vidania fulgoroideorum TaxID=881286 RepID=A0A975AEI6_9PROT|nr:hypothetical protein JSR02_00820 [Candidatus Vidania fulgoroideae]